MKTGNFQVLLIAIILFSFSGCKSKQTDSRKWITWNTTNSGLYLKQNNDTLIIYILETDQCDTNIVGIHRCNIVSNNSKRIKFKLPYDRYGEVSFYEDSTVFSFISLDNEQQVFYKLLPAKKNLEYENWLIDLKYYLSEIIIRQEVQINVLSLKVELDERANELVIYFDSLKRELVHQSLNVNYEKKMCWHSLTGLDSLLLEPQYLKKGNIDLVNIYQAKNIFQMNFDENYSNRFSKINISDVLYSRFFDSDDSLKNIFATVGEAIIFYNELILEIYRNNAK